MGQFIVKLEGLYLLWSTVTDAPCGPAMTLEALRKLTLRRDGQRGLRELESRLLRVEEKGTSSYDDNDPDEVMWLNRAGVGDTPLTREQIIDYFVRRKCKGREPNGFVEPPGLNEEDPRGWTYERYLGKTS